MRKTNGSEAYGQAVAERKDMLHLLEWLCCPFCGGRLNREKIDHADLPQGWGILSCYCGRYPMAAGIPVLKKDPALERVIALIENGHHQEALLTLIPIPDPVASSASPQGWFGSRLKRKLRRVFGLPEKTMDPALCLWRERIGSVLSDRSDQAKFRDLLALYFEGKKDNFDYNYYRFGQPRHLVALSFVSIIRRPHKPILDLACGCGHITRSLVRQAGGQPVIGIDRSFFGTYAAKRWIAPEAQYICCDADSSLPFSDSTFAAAICADAFHYFPHKKTCVRELERLVDADGFFMLVWVHSANVRMPYDGLPLPPEGYLALIEHLPHRFVADSAVLGRYLRREGPPLAHSPELRDLAQEPLVSFVVSRREELFQDYGTFDNWPHATGNLTLNRIYTESNRTAAKLCLKRSFPSRFYEQDHAQCKEYLPETVELTSQMLEDLAQGRQTPDIERLIAKCVIVDMPREF
jgi:SAM-dependent methyltransferase/uncharacterized protein YbaR (Trm112 family)